MKCRDMLHNDEGYSVMLDEIRPRFEAIALKYRKRWGITVLLADPTGRVVAGEDGLDCSKGPECSALRQKAIHEALRWGEPSMLLCPANCIVWAVPLMCNSAVIGGLVAEKVKVAVDEGEDGLLTTSEVRKAALDLFALAKEANLTNAALLQIKQMDARRESERAEAIHELKGQDCYGSIRDIYLLEEPVLMSAIKRGDRLTAREIINRILVGIYYYGRERPTLLKSFILELVVTMSRSAVEAGADPSELLGANYSSFADLARIESEEDLCKWLVSMLERMMDAIKSNHRYPNSVLLSAALKYMRDNIQNDLSRDDVANVACLSPSHFSRVVKQTFGQSFTELMSRMRIEKARELLSCTEKSLVQICLDCGFNDQSYFTKVFQRYTGHTPGEYRNSRTSSFR